MSVGEDNHDGLGSNGGGGFVPSSALHLPSVAARTTRNIKVKGISHRAMRNVVKFLNKGAIGFDEDEAEKVDEFVEAAIALKLRGVSRKEQVSAKTPSNRGAKVQYRAGHLLAGLGATR